MAKAKNTRFYLAQEKNKMEQDSKNLWKPARIAKKIIYVVQLLL